jgi:hypothetical protein
MRPPGIAGGRSLFSFARKLPRVRWTPGAGYLWKNMGFGGENFHHPPAEYRFSHEVCDIGATVLFNLAVKARFA